MIEELKNAVRALIETAKNVVRSVVERTVKPVKVALATVAVGAVSLTGVNFGTAPVSHPVTIVAAVQRSGGQVLDVVNAFGDVLSPITASAQAYPIVSAATDGTITFSPSMLVTPIITGVIACVVAGASLVLIWIGVRWLYKVLHGSK